VCVLDAIEDYPKDYNKIKVNVYKSNEEVEECFLYVKLQDT
jgi:hypothetical protein